jgi:hypothetical protein
MENAMLKNFMRKLGKLHKEDYTITYYTNPENKQNETMRIGFDIILEQNTICYNEKIRGYKIDFCNADKVNKFEEWLYNHCDNTHSENGIRVEGVEMGINLFEFVKDNFTVRVTYPLDQGLYPPDF